MFTGIVEELGTIEAVEDLADAYSIAIRAEVCLADTRPGDSIAVNGCCLTVVELESGRWTADVMRETIRCTSLASARPGDPVNLERAVRADQRLGGHLVQGHVDAVGQIRSRIPSEHWDLVEVQLPAELAGFVVVKGSITVDGVSLTVVDVGADWFSVSLIPETLTRTTLGRRQVGDPVNLEVDVIAKYVAKAVAPLLAAREESR